MASEKQYQTIRRKKKSYTGIIIVFIIALVIVVGGILIGLYAISNTATTVVESTDIVLTCSVSGNDLIIFLMESPSSHKLVSIEIKMEGFELPPGYSQRQIPNTAYPKEIIYEKIFSGMSGSLPVSFKGIFSDGSSKVIWMKNIKIT